MGILAWPQGVYLGSTERCIVCERNIDLAELSAGMITASGVQTFACNDHFWNETQFIIGYTKFMAAQRSAVKTDKENATQGGDHEWSLH